jgi:hypothetical protein
MQRRLALAAALASMLTLALAATALAGGWANAVMDTPPDGPAGPNEPVTLGFTLMQHGVTPVDWGNAQIVLTNAESGERVTAAAHPEGSTGHWVAEVTLPANGSWNYEVRHDLQITMMGAQPISVGPAAAGTGSAAIGVSPALLAAGGILALLGLAVLTSVLLAVRQPRTDEARA